MDLKEYAPLALRTASGIGSGFINAGLGIAGEAGEIADIVKKVCFHDKPLDRDHMIEELGDLAWYMNRMVHEMDTTWDEVLQRNIKKLEARYPDLRFDPERANNRDVEAEQRAMTGG